MSILTSASSTSVSRGYDYYKNGKVMNVNQLNDLEFEGYVEGSLKNPYYVKINIKHPKKSYCDCPHANGNITCKHMTALYFEVFPEEVEDYESWLNSDYDDEEGEYYIMMTMMTMMIMMLSRIILKHHYFLMLF